MTAPGSRSCHLAQNPRAIIPPTGSRETEHHQGERASAANPHQRRLLDTIEETIGEETIGEETIAGSAGGDVGPLPQPVVAMVGDRCGSKVRGTAGWIAKLAHAFGRGTPACTGKTYMLSGSAACTSSLSRKPISSEAPSGFAAPSRMPAYSTCWKHVSSSAAVAE